MLIRWGLIPVLAVSLMAPRASAGQGVVGTVLEAGSDRPVVGALVRLVGSDGQERAIYLTTSDGSYRFGVDGPGSYHLRVERIGFASSRMGPLDVPASGTVRFDISLATAPILLEDLAVGVVAEGRACQVDAEVGAATQLVWDEARKALEAASWTERRAALQFRLRSRLRRLAPRGLSVIEEDRSTRTVWSANSVRSLPPDDLARGGYVRSRPDGEVDYFAPDAEVLLSDAFLETHCLGLGRAPTGEEHLVGLTFEPIPGRDTPDIAGTLWVDRGSGRLDRLEFRYTGLETFVGDEYATGEVRFEELADGHWIVTDWFIRAPVVGVVRGTGVRGTFGRQMVTEVMETGTEVAWVKGQGVEWSADRAVYPLEGTVYDSVAAGPLVGAEVRLAGRGWSGVTDSTGGFTLADVPEGIYRISFDHPKLDSLGVEPGWRDVRVASSAAPIQLAIPSRERIVALGCSVAGGVLVGRVLDVRGESVPGAAVRVVAPDGVAADARDEVAGPTDLTDAEGWFRLCGLEADAVVGVEARVGRLASNRVEARVTPGRLDRISIELDLSRGVPYTGPDGRSVFGVVTDVASDEPLSAVSLVLLDDAGGVVARDLTDDRGRFALDVDARGDYHLSAERIGYATLEGQPISLRFQSQQVEIRLASAAVELDGMVVSVEARSEYLEMNGFYRREVMTGGHFLTPELINMNRPQRTTDMLYRLPSVQRYDSSSRDGNTTARRIQLRAALRGIQRSSCLPAIYIDGALARPGLPDDTVPMTGYPTIDDLVSADEVEAIEVYETPATLPVQFSGPGTICGAVVIWRRRGPAP